MDMIYSPKFREFIARMDKRLSDGQREYKDQSFFAEPMKLWEEVNEEILDQAAWAFIKWVRWQETGEKIKRIGVA